MSQNKKTKIILIGIVIIGVILRVALALRLEVCTFQIDLGISDNFKYDYKDEFYEGLLNFDRNYLGEGGHLEYIFTIYSKGCLPDINGNQCYHPPLSQALFAGFLKLESLFTQDSKFLVESLEFLPIIYSILMILVVYKILKEIGFEDKDTILPIAIITFHPLFVFLSRLINTDGLVSLLILISILYLIKWYKEPSYKNVIILGVAIGLGAMTKSSTVIMALPLIVVYTKKIIESVHKKESIKHIIIQGILFSFITLPMVFWYPIRNYYKFGQKLFWVPDALDYLKVPDTSFFKRWILSKELIFSIEYDRSATNVWANLIISSINFAMDSFAVPYIVSIILRIVSVFLIIISIVSMIKYSRKIENKDLLFILLITYVTWVIGYIFFNISMPYSCTIHARYIVTAIVIGIIYIGLFYKYLKNQNIKYCVIGLSALFILLSIILFIDVFITKGIVTLVVIL